MALHSEGKARALNTKAQSASSNDILSIRYCTGILGIYRHHIIREFLETPTVVGPARFPKPRHQRALDLQGQSLHVLTKGWSLRLHLPPFYSWVSESKPRWSKKEGYHDQYPNTSASSKNLSNCALNRELKAAVGVTMEQLLVLGAAYTT